MDRIEKGDAAVRIKVCGLTRPDEAVACFEAGTDWIGLNFHPPSPRSLDLESARQILAAVPDRHRVVGLFVNRPPYEVATIGRQLGLSIVQLHGDEPPEDLPLIGPFFIIKAFRLGDHESVARMIRYLGEAERIGRVPDAVLLDSYVPGVPGGTGASIRGDILESLPPLPRLILAGGLTPENVAERIGRVRPWMVDVASGVESSPGRKSIPRLRDFVAAARPRQAPPHRLLDD